MSLRRVTTTALLVLALAGCRSGEGAPVPSGSVPSNPVPSLYLPGLPPNPQATD